MMRSLSRTLLVAVVASCSVYSPATVYSGVGFGGHSVGPRRLMTPACGRNLPTVRNVGAIASGVGTIDPGLPTGSTAGDLVLMFCESDSTDADHVTASGWQEIAHSSNTGTRLTVLYRVLTSDSDATTTNDTGNHQACRTLGITKGTYCPQKIFGPTNSNTNASGTSVTISGVTTTLGNSLILQASAGSLPQSNSTTQFSSAANSDLGSVTEQIDNSRNSGNGGSIFVLSGTKVTAGSVGNGTATAATTAVRANATIAINGF